jgi:hypothetical protein
LTALVAKPFVVLVRPGGPVGSAWQDWLGWPVVFGFGAPRAPAVIVRAAMHAMTVRTSFIRHLSYWSVACLERWYDNRLLPDSAPKSS